MNLEPVQQTERIESVDVLRGFSLLGILLLNIVSFGLPFAAYLNPSAYGGQTGDNLGIWTVAMTFWEGKMRAIFSMLFGTSAIILLSRAEARGAGIHAADIYYRRTLWLILFGLLHAHLIWYGDILYAYGMVGLFLFPFRTLRAKTLILLGAALIVLHSLQNVGAGIGIKEMSEKAAEAEKLEASGKALTSEQKKVRKEWNDVRDMFAPTKEKVDEEIKAHRGGWVDNLKQRSGIAVAFQFTMFFQFMFLDVFAMLILGMGLAKAGVFSAQLSYRFYATSAVIGFLVGAPLNYWASRQWAASGFDIPAFFTYLGSTADPGRFLVAGGYIGLIMMICKSSHYRWITAPLAAVGRTALSNYLLTSILLTIYFDGWGLGNFAKIERAKLYWVVLVMWAINLIISPIWLRYFRYGPAEWAWRSLTYWKRQPMGYDVKS
ncbi:MAG: DUF418 domain-containing protein [Acidobacteria bacterium]|nr:DUF418 domain-containing protein [Acidobacteriota bacterium]